MPQTRSAIDAISPAFIRTKRLLFEPFRLSVWARYGVIALTTGEFAGSSGAANASFNPDGRGPGDKLLSVTNIPWERAQEYLPWIVGGVLVLAALGLLALYIASIFRFVLFDAVVEDRYHLRAGWERWQERGANYFLWQVGFISTVIVALALLVGGPLFLAWRAGLFQQPDQHVAVLVLGAIGLFFLALGLILATALIAVLAKDFVVPLMALENLSVLAAWRRLLSWLAVEKAAYAGYILMKIVLAMGSAILFGIINVIIVLGALVVLGVAGVALIFGGKAAGLVWDFYTVAAVVLLGSVALTALLYIISFVSSPALVFFQAYALQFFAGRYPLLAGRLEASLPPPASPPPAVTPATT
ncbi:MAG: DUF7544 domain-containing protein [Candidatus Acidiferrales bacterium]